MALPFCDFIFKVTQREFYQLFFCIVYLLFSKYSLDLIALTCTVILATLYHIKVRYIVCLKVDWIDRLVRKWRVEGLHLYIRESGTLQLMTARYSGLKISNLCLYFFYSLPSTVWYGIFSIQRYLKHTSFSF